VQVGTSKALTYTYVLLCIQHSGGKTVFRETRAGLSGWRSVVQHDYNNMMYKQNNYSESDKNIYVPILCFFAEKVQVQQLITPVINMHGIIWDHN